jgi:transcriptional regulator with XRE-family HTH domain
MIDKAELGRRLREARTARGFTLKEMDRLSGFSATHISEIERGKTSPTIGALVRIAQALGRAPSYFIEAESLPDTAHVPAGSAPRRDGGGVTVELLTPGVPGGRLSARRLTIDSAGEGVTVPAGVGSIGGFLLSGRLRVESAGITRDLDSGAALYLQLEAPVRLLPLGDEPVRLLVIATGPQTG